MAAPGLDHPGVLVFDELYYVSDAHSQLDVGVARSFTAHPPLGTWLIAAGIALVGRSPAGWRLVPLLAGVASVVLLHRLALGLLPRTPTGRAAAAGAALLLVSDGTWLVLSRVAMLDGPLIALMLATVTAAVAARGADGARRRLHLLLAGAALGAALAVKWSGALAAPMVLVVLATDATGGLRAGARRAAAAIPALAVTAGLVYGAAWVPFALLRDDVELASCPVEARPCTTTGGVAGVVDQHASLLRYHLTLDVDSEAATPPSLWPLMQVPINFHHPACNTRTAPVEDPIAVDVDPGCAAAAPDADTVQFSGNRVVWFGFLALLPLLAASTRRDAAATVALAGWALAWLPWLLVTRTAYLWYLAPAVPFAALGLVVVALWLPRTNILRTYLGAVAGGVVGVAASLLPGLPVGTVIIGWAAGGFAAGGLTSPREPDRQAHSLAALGVLVAAGLIGALAWRGLWTAGPAP